jgi:hypothetical protein
LTTIRTLAPQMETQPELVIEKPTAERVPEQRTWNAPLETNRLTAVFDRTLPAVPMN